MGGLSVLGGAQRFQQRNGMPAEKKGDLFPWGVSPSEHDRAHAEYSSDPAASADIFTPPSIWRDIRNLVLIIVSLVVIASVIYERWFFLPQRSDPPQTTPPNVPTAKPSSLLPFCPPERDECWR